MKNNNYALIMAGGQGSRFWPLSTVGNPKQFLKITGNESLILQTFNRLASFIPIENIFVVAGARYRENVLKALPDFIENNFIQEPCARNTAPCLIMSNIHISKINKDAKILVVPADHYIPENNIFKKQLIKALEMAEEKYIITSGIAPNSPHTGYGYIETGEQLNHTQYYNVQSFREKPNFKKAQEYFRLGSYLWNSGMFLYKAKNFKHFFKEYNSEYYKLYLELENSFGTKEFNEIFSAIKGESIDYALMEKLKEVLVFKADFTWNDVGSWSSIYEMNKKDNFGNCVPKGNALFINSKNSFVFSESFKPIAMIGVNDLVVVDTPNGILICDMQQLQDVKQVVNQLKEN